MGLKSIGAALSIGLALGWTANGWRLGEKLAEVRAEHALALADEQERARQVESGWYAAMNEVQRNALRKEESMAAELAFADHARDGMLKQIDRLSRRPASCPSATDGGASAETVNRMYAELLAEADRLAGVFASEAGKYRIAGEACETAYEAVRTETIK